MLSGAPAAIVSPAQPDPHARHTSHFSGGMMTSSPAVRSVSVRPLGSLFVVLALVIVWGAAPAAQAPVSFATGVSYTTNSGFDFPATQAVGDFNNDGASDVIVV